MQNVVIYKNLSVKGLCRRCLSVRGPEPHFPTVYVYRVYLFTQGRGGESLTREKGRGAAVHKAGSKIPT
jgi:hypothetical protein